MYFLLRNTLFSTECQIKKKGLRPQETLTAALAAIKAGSSINQPSKRYKIPRTTLGLHYRNQNAVKCLGRKNCFKC